MNTFESLIFIPEGSLIEHKKLVKGSSTFLKEAQGQVKLIAFSKENKKDILPVMQQLKIDQYFDHLFFKEDITEHPFRTIINNLKLDPDTCLIIGNDLNDEIRAANQENLKSLWIAPKSKKVPITPHPTLKLARLSDLEFYLNLES